MGLESLQLCLSLGLFPENLHFSFTSQPTFPAASWMDFYPAFLQLGWGWVPPLPCAQLCPSGVWGARLPQIFPINKSNPQNRQEFLFWETKWVLVTCWWVNLGWRGEEEEGGMLLFIPSLPVCLSLSDLNPNSSPQFCLSSRTQSCPPDPKALRVLWGLAAEPLFPHGGEGEEELGQFSVILAFCVYWGKEIPSEVEGNVPKSIL